jgi:hypothetical protein
VAKAAKNEVFITPPVILSFPNLFEMSAAPGSTNLKYSCSLVFPPDTPAATRKKLEAMIDAVGLEHFGNLYANLKKNNKLTFPIREEDDEKKGYPAGSYFMNAGTKSKPGIVGPVAGTDGKPATITDPAEMYPGAIVRASINFFAYDTAGNKGVACGLRNIQKLREGKRLDSRKAAEDEFDAVADAAFDDSLM